MIRILPILLGLAVIAAGTIIQGEYADRWRQDISEQLNIFGERVTLVPMQIGDWECIEEVQIPKEEWAATNCVAYISRHYKNSDGQLVSLYLVAGSGRHITIHTPDQCFVGAGFEMESRPSRIAITLPTGEHDAAQFAYTTFLREDSSSREHLRTFWSYSTNGEWEGPPEWAKSQYGALDAIYKVYITTNIDELHGKSEAVDSANAAFARELMPILSELLFDSQDSTSAGEEQPAAVLADEEQPAADTQ